MNEDKGTPAMKSYPALRRWLSALVTLGVFAAVLLAGVLSGRSGEQGEKPDPKQYPWPLFGGSVSRNMVNTIEHGTPTDWDAPARKHVQWVADLGSKAYGGPVVADGKVFVGT